MIPFKRITLVAALLAAATTVTSSFADTPATPDGMPGGAPAGFPGGFPGGAPGAMPGGMPPPFGEHMPHGPGFVVIGDLEHLQHLYELSGREAEMGAIYRDVLAKTTDPMIRHYVYDALARSEMKPSNVDQAIVTIRTSLNEDLDALAKHPEKAPKAQ